MRANKLPMMSVVVCTFNGEKVIARAIESLLAQTYSKVSFEIMVVDDGSTDNTAEIVQSYPVKYIRHEKNQGLAAARNTGLKRARGQIYVSFDDDCTVGPDWLEQLAKGYEHTDIAGVASILVSPREVRGLADHYMVATGSGNPPHVNTSARNHWTKRLVSYIVDHLHARPAIHDEVYRVGAISGATASFPMEVLQAVGGWDSTMSGIEDTDLCHRISVQFPKHSYYAVKTAEVIHDPKLSVKQLLNRQLARGTKNLAYYRKFDIFPPIFPFPLLWLGLTVLTTFLIPKQGYLAGLILPLMLYVWWPIRAVREKKPLYIFFPYLQMAEEISAMAGMATGIVMTAIKWLLRPVSITVITTAIWAVITLVAPPTLLGSIFTVLFLLLTPGLLLFKIIVPDSTHHQFWQTISYAVGLSVIGLMVTGLAINFFLPLIGFYQPLSKNPLVLGVSLLVFILVAILARRRPKLSFPSIRLRFTFYEVALIILGTLLPVLSTLGAISLNNGRDNKLTIAMLIGVAVYTLALIWPRNKIHQTNFAFGLYSIALSLLLATSLRGWYITGHDIMQEYQVFQLTTQHSLWNMKFYQDAYNACLSITILPTILAKLTSITDPYIYKTVYQAIFALVPVILFQSLVPYVSKRIAFLAAFVFISFPTFMVDMPMLARQEIAFLSFSLAFMAVLSNKFTTRQRGAIIVIMLIGTVLSHYSTGYVAIGAIVGAKVLEVIYQLWMKIKNKPVGIASPWTPLSWSIIGVMILVIYLWNTQITHTSTSITTTVSNAVNQLPRLLDGSSKTGESAYSLVGEKATDDELFTIFKKTSVNQRDLDSTNYYPEEIIDKYPISMATETIQPLTRIGQWIERKQISLFEFYDSSRQGYAALVQVLMVVGSIVLLVSRRLFRVPRQYPIMGLAFLGIIVLQVLLPSEVINYGLLRLIQQGLLFLALPIVLAAMSVPRLLRFSTDASIRMVAIGFIGLYIILSGLAPSITGGYKPALTTTNSGFYYDAYCTQANELAGFAWLKKHAPAGSIINADEFARRKMIAYAGMYARPNMTPDTISKDAYVFLSSANSTTNKIPVYASGTLLYQTVPVQFLEATKTLVYSNGDVKIYH